MGSRRESVRSRARRQGDKEIRRQGDKEIRRQGDKRFRHAAHAPCLLVSLSRCLCFSPCLLVFLSPCLPVSVSPCLCLSPCLLVSLSPCLLVSLSPCLAWPPARCPASPCRPRAAVLSCRTRQPRQPASFRPSSP